MPRSLAPITKPSPTDLPVRRSSRTSTQPSWLQDYVTGSQANHSTTAQDRPNGTRYLMNHFLSNSQFSFTHSAYLGNITSTKEPHTYAQTILDPNWQKELSALHLNQMWTLTHYSSARNPSDANGFINKSTNRMAVSNKYKARLVAKGTLRLKVLTIVNFFYQQQN